MWTILEVSARYHVCWRIEVSRGIGCLEMFIIKEKGGREPSYGGSGRLQNEMGFTIGDGRGL